MLTLRSDAKQRARALLRLYDGVHRQLADGAAWLDLDNGVGRQMSYEDWMIVMRQRLFDALREILATDD